MSSRAATKARTRATTGEGPVPTIEDRGGPFSASAALDVFVVCALGLPRTRYFLTGALRLVAPLGLIGWVIGVFFTAPQTRDALRDDVAWNAARA